GGRAEQLVARAVRTATSEANDRRERAVEEWRLWDDVACASRLVERPWADDRVREGPGARCGDRAAHLSRALRHDDVSRPLVRRLDARHQRIGWRRRPSPPRPATDHAGGEASAGGATQQDVAEGAARLGRQHGVELARAELAKCVAVRERQPARFDLADE